MDSARRHPKVREGIVVKDRTEKTRVVQVTRLLRESRFQKVIKRHIKYSVHDEKNESHMGDKVRIVQSRPISRSKRWRVVKLIEKAKS